jgi:hypothetical protein
MLRELRHALCATVAGGYGQAAALAELGQTLPLLPAVLSPSPAQSTVRAPVLHKTSRTL